MFSVYLPTFEHRTSVLRTLLKAAADSHARGAIAALLEAAARGTLPLDGLLVAGEADRPLGAALYVPQPDGSAFVWPPIVLPATDAETVADALLTDLRARLDALGVWLGQCLLETGNAEDRTRLARNEFTHLADLVYLEKTLARPRPAPGTELETILFDPVANADRFASALERTYAGTLDCPGLTGLRTAAEALESHKLAGQFDPAWWRIFRVADEDAGVLLLNDHPEQNAWEVVYLGVVPEARGRGLGRAMLLSGLADARAAGRGSVLLAVDSRNKYARRIYSELGFVELGTRSAFVRISRTRGSTH
jgi:GNAT superfamily N-acetyltransferase